ncbi:hypothetical protein C2W62_23320 [Candidatus Entotheonella serta]|nr:hypothetical protein C2W62_23320 [Candidatus Entotheonella serta]
MFLTEEIAKERELAFLEAFAMGQDPPLRPTIQDLEHYAPQWTSLVPANPSVRAAVAHLFGQKYTFTAQTAPGIRRALGLDDEAVQRAYHRLYNEPLEALFAPQITFGEQLRWNWSTLTQWPELLSPFWTTFLLTLALGLPQACLGLPIALAHIGPLPGIGLIVLFGLINVFTMACMAEACTRSGSMHYGIFRTNGNGLPGG